MKKNIMIAVILSFAFASMAAAQGYAFSKTLKVGATGLDVAQLQSWLIQRGYHIPSIESGAIAKGTFGSQTKAAVVKYQKAAGLPATGFVGPLTLAKLNGNYVLTVASQTTIVQPASAQTSAQMNASDAGGGMAAALAGITTPGANGILAVTQGPLSSSVLTVGQQMVPIMTVRIQAQNSDIAVPLFTLDLGTDTNIYNKIFNKIYLTDTNNNILYSSPLNASTVVQVQGQYVVGMAGMHFIVPKGTYKDLVVKADLFPSIDSKYLNESPWYVSVDALSVGGIDGAGVNLYSPASNGLIVQGLTINASLVDNSQANLSTAGDTPVTNTVSVSDTANGNYLGLPVLNFNVYAQNDTLHLHKVVVNIANTGGGTASAAYLLQGSTPVASASITSGVATFDNITDGTPGATIPVGQTQEYTVKADVVGVTTSAAAITATMSAGSQVIYNSIDSNITVSGSPTGNLQTVNGIGPSFSLSSAPTIVTQGSNQVGTTVATSTIVASFPLNISAVGSDVYFGTTASSTSPLVANTSGPAFLFNVLDSTGATVYSGYGLGTSAGVAVGAVSNSGSLNGTKTILPTLPNQVTAGVTNLNTFKVPNQANVSLGTVQFQFDGKSIAGSVLTGGPYKVNLAAVRYQTISTSGVLTVATSSFMAGLQQWTTNGRNP